MLEFVFQIKQFIIYYFIIDTIKQFFAELIRLKRMFFFITLQNKN